MIVYPQTRLDDLDYAGKRVVVIGSGAPQDAGAGDGLGRPPTSPCCSVRRPTVARPAEDALANKLRRNLSAKLATN
jgi:cation diffusion facilitator CzcD-associated flavoprotein CzcO